MSNNGMKSVNINATNVATNGRSNNNNSASANNTKSINIQQRLEGGEGSRITNALPERGRNTTNTTTTVTTKAHNNDSASGNIATATHRRDNSTSFSSSRQQQLQTHLQQHPKESLASKRQYFYARPQTPAPQQAIREDGQQALGEEPAILQSSPPTAFSTPPSLVGDGVDNADNTGLLLVYSEDALVSGTLEALITHMVPTADYYPERNYTFSFLLSARLFVRPHELLAQISQTWERQQQEQQQQKQQLTSWDVVDEVAAHQQPNIPPAIAFTLTSASPLTQRKLSSVSGAGEVLLLPPDATNVSTQRPQRTATQKSAQNCIRLLAEWIETFPYDFRDERLMQQVRLLARKCVYIDNSLGKQVSRILQLLVQRLTALEQYEEFLQTLCSAAEQQQHMPHFTATSATASAAYNANNCTEHHGQTQQHNQPHHLHNLHNSLGKCVVAALNHVDSHHKPSANTPFSSHHGHINAAFSSSTAFTTPPAHHTKLSTEPSDAPPHSPDVPLDIIDLCPSCAQLAHQLTAIELERLSHIGPEEFVQAFAKEYQQQPNSSASVSVSASATTSASVAASTAHSKASGASTLNDMKKTRNLESYVEWFNRLSYFTATEVVKYPKKKQRVRVIEYWIETARECFNIGNFNSLMAIIAGLNLAPISRLKKTWSKVQSAKFSVLEHQMDPTSNFNSYRSTLKAAMWRSEGATEERERIIIPFFSLFVKDLYFLNEGCSNRLPNNHINFEKCSQLSKQIMEFNEWKKVSCPFEKLPNVIAFLQNSPVLNENTLSMASFECEPPETTEEKGRYKTVKAETKQQLLQQMQEQQQQQ